MEKDLEFRLCDYNPLVLAYLGDAYFELLIRARLVRSSDCLPSVLNERAKEFVTAHSQSAAVAVLEPHLTEKETSVFKAGRNARPPHTPRKSAVAEYRRATGLECLFGYLFMSNQKDRAEELFGILTDNKKEESENA